MSVSLITVTYNSGGTLRACWSQLRLPPDCEWIVVDNASGDDSAEVAASLGARVVRSSENLGFSAANNLGFAMANGDFVGFVNPDVEVDVADLAQLALVASSRGALVAPQLHNPDGSEQPNGRGYPFLWSKIRNRLRGDDPRYLLRSPDGKPRAICWGMGAAIFGMREAFERIQGWDPHFFLYYEDKDICLRAWDADVPVLLVPGGRWVHGWARETSSLNWRAWRRELASMGKFYWRYPEFLLGPRRVRKRHPTIDDAVFMRRLNK